MSREPLDPEFSSYEVWTKRNDPSMARAFLALLKEVRQGIERHRGFSLLRREVEAQDLAHEVLRRAFSDPRLRGERFQHQGAGSLRAYLRELTHSEITDRIRARAALKRGGHHQVQPLEGETPTGSLVPELPSRAPSPTSIAAAIELAEQAVARLSATERQAFLLRVRDGLDFEEIAKRLGLVSAASARGLYYRAKERVGPAN